MSGLMSDNRRLAEGMTKSLPEMSQNVGQASKAVAELADTIKGIKNPLPSIGQGIKNTFVTPQGGLTSASKWGLGGAGGLLGLYALTKALSNRNKKRNSYE
jgi:hypothetical protein